VRPDLVVHTRRLKMQQTLETVGDGRNRAGSVQGRGGGARVPLGVVDSDQAVPGARTMTVFVVATTLAPTPAVTVRVTRNL
jgi:hypothetical protein